MYITYISVSKSTPLAVTGPHGQLASTIYPCVFIHTMTINHISLKPLWAVFVLFPDLREMVCRAYSVLRAIARMAHTILCHSRKKLTNMDTNLSSLAI